MDTFITVNQAISISPIFYLIFTVLLGFVYHLIRNTEYKGTLKVSVVIGIVIGLIININTDLVKYIILDLVFIILVLLGGFFAIGLKNLISKSNKEDSKYPETWTKFPGKWWNKQNPRFRAILVMGICIVGVIMVINLSYPYYDEQVKLQLEKPVLNEIPPATQNAGNTSNDTSNDTTTYALKGSTESGATVKITIDELGIHNQTIPLDANHNFEYKFSIANDVTQSNIIVEATKAGKKSNNASIHIVRS